MNPPTKTAARDALLANGVSRFKRVTSTRPSINTSLRQILDGIRDGQWRREVEELRDTYRTEGKEAYKEQRKTSLELFTPSGIFGERNNDGLTHHSGIVALDFDNLGEKLAATRAQLVQDGRALCIFTSPSGDGLKVLVPVDATDSATHRAAYSAALQQFSHMGVAADKSCRDPARLCYVSYDSDIWVNSSSSLPLLSGSASEPITVTEAIPVAVPIPMRQEEEEGGVTVPVTVAMLPTQEKGIGDSPAARIRQLKKLEKKDPAMAGLYELHVARQLTAEVGKRNDQLAALVPYWHRALSGILAERLAALTLELNRGAYTGSIEEHMKSMRKLWDGCEERYRAGLSPLEREAYTELDDPEEQAAFRIMRDLAIAGNGEFYMGCAQLELRLGRHNGYRLLGRFRGAYRLIDELKKGERWEKGRRRLATSWRWLLPLPVASNATSIAPVTPVVEKAAACW